MGSSGSTSSKQEKYNEMAKQYAPEKQYAATDIGLNASRGCTDLLGWLMYIVCFAVMMLVAATAFSQGDPDRLIYGIDRAGNLCGKRTYVNGTDVTPVVNLKRNGTPLVWEDLKVIVFPIPTPDVCGKQLIATSGPTCEDLVKDALDLGICTDVCPDAGEKITWYDGSNYFGDQEVGFSVALSTKKTLNRCIPEQPEKLIGNLAELFGVAGTLQSGFAELRDALHVVAICIGICIVLCFLWLFILRRTVKPTVFASLIVLFFGTCFVVYICYSNYDRSSGGYTEKFWMVMLIATSAFLVVYLLLCCFFFKNINVACDTIEEASKIPLKIKTMTLVPPIVTLLIVPMFAFHVLVALFLQTIGDIDEKKVISYYNVTEGIPSGVDFLPDPNIALNASIDLATEVTVKFLKDENWMTYTHLYNLFMFLWSMGLLNAIGYLTLSLCAVFWYWSRPGDNKEPQAGVARGLWITFRYHLGSLMVGTFIIAVIQLVRFMMARMESRMRKISDNAGTRCIISCVQCCLACFERLIKFLNKNAYIMIAICGDSFCGGARRALFLLLKHAWSVIAVNFIAEWVMFFGKLQVVAATTALGWLMITQLDMAGDDKATQDCILTLITIAVISFVISTIFVAVFSVCVDTVLMSFCYDLDVNNGRDRPYYLPKDLQKSLGHHNVQTYEAHPMPNQEMQFQPNFADPRMRRLTPPPGRGSKQSTPLEKPLIYASAT
eukprot:TRINITY_DN20367_c0_g1_i1.p1 TRINITY_DN20367_c0_g1~~TRINITY_DN20367_c0_g1_i1.p1  ORF type:complete len:721 (+),score=295.34 TRINITY_DN20367_c0_g1_i1:167-2329(+)